MQPLDEIGQMFAADVRMLGLKHLALATYVETTQMLHFPYVELNGAVVNWPATRAAEHSFGRIVERRKPTFIAPFCSSAYGWYGLPLSYAGTIVGVLAVGPQVRAQNHRRLLLACADLLAVSIYTTEQLESLQLTFAEQASTLAGISEIARELNATVDAQQIADLLLLHALRASDGLAGVVFRYTAGNTGLMAQRDVEPAVLANLERNRASVAQVIENNLDHEYQVLPSERLPDAVRFDTRALLYALIPLRHDERLLGLLILATRPSFGIDPAHIRFLQQLAAHAALALNNAGAYTEIAQQRDLLNRRMEQLQAVARISQAISAHLNLKALLPEIVSVVHSTLHYRTALLSLVDPADPTVVQRVAAIGVPDVEWQQLREQVVPLSYYQSLMIDRFRISNSYYIPHDQQATSDIDMAAILERSYRAELDDRAPDEWHADDILLVPFYGHQGGLIGILSVDDPADRLRPTPEMLTVLEIFATQAATAIEGARMYADMERQALTDNLTGLANQRHLMMHLAQHMSWAERHQQGLAILALDIDHFKSYNDSFGHLAGNLVLREFAQIVQQNVRSGDLVARWGGEEFLALLPQSTEAGALEVAERIRQAIGEYAFPYRSITVSIGVAVLKPDMTDQEFLGAADAALYRAKLQRDAVMT